MLCGDYIYIYATCTFNGQPNNKPYDQHHSLLYILTKKICFGFSAWRLRVLYVVGIVLYNSTDQMDGAPTAK